MKIFQLCQLSTSSLLVILCSVVLRRVQNGQVSNYFYTVSRFHTLFCQLHPAPQPVPLPVSTAPETETTPAAETPPS